MKGRYMATKQGCRNAMRRALNRIFNAEKSINETQEKIAILESCIADMKGYNHSFTYEVKNKDVKINSRIKIWQGPTKTVYDKYFSNMQKEEDIYLKRAITIAMKDMETRLNELKSELSDAKSDKADAEQDYDDWESLLYSLD
jgi:hypothetical protein